MRITITHFVFVTCVLFFSCEKQDDTFIVGNNRGPSLNDVISFVKVSPINLIADSASVCSITVKISSEADPTNNNIIFSAKGGLFSNRDTQQTIRARTDGYASASFLSDTPGFARIRASILNFSIDTSISITASLPQDMLLSADKYSGDATASFKISTKLFRNPGLGKVSDPIKVYYSIEALDTSLNLVYPEFAYSSKQNAEISVINPYSIIGRFNVTGKVLSASGDTLSRKILLVIK